MTPSNGHGGQPARRRPTVVDRPRTRAGGLLVGVAVLAAGLAACGGQVAVVRTVSHGPNGGSILATSPTTATAPTTATSATTAATAATAATPSTTTGGAGTATPPGSAQPATSGAVHAAARKPPTAPPPNCTGVAVTTPPAGPYTVKVTGTLVGTQTILTPQGPAVTDIAASICGTLQVPTERSSVAPANIVFAPTQTLIYDQAGVFVAGQKVTFVADGPSVTTVGSSPGPNGGLELTVATAVTAIVSPGPHLYCQIGPVVLNLSTQVPGGVPLSGPLQAATATIGQAGFLVPPVPADELVPGAGGPGVPKGPGPGSCTGIGPIILAQLGLPTTNTSTLQVLNLSVTAQ